MKKKAIIFDFAYFMLMMFIIAVILTLTYYAFSTVNDSLTGDNGFTGTAKTIVQNYEDNHASMINWYYLIIFFGVFLVLLLIAYALRTQPFMLVFLFLVLVIFVSLAVHFANMYYDMTESTQLKAKTDNLYIIKDIMFRYPYLIAGMGILFIAILLSSGKPNDEYKI
jgi:hypothetical protein